MSVEVPGSVVEEKSSPWTLERTELPNGFKARFIGHDVTNYEQVNDLHHRVRAILEGAGIDEETCGNAELIASELAANAIEHGLGHELSELDLVALRSRAGDPAEVYISVINPTDEDTIIGSNPSMTDEENEVATSGRGLLLTEYLTMGDWGSRVVKLRSEKATPENSPSLVMYAHLGAAGLADSQGDHRRAA